MELDRRRLMSLAAAGSLGMMLPGPSANAAATSSTGFIQHFSNQGVQVLDPLPLITGVGFNGGLRYDDTRPSYPDASSMCVQPACRIEDGGKSSEPGVLALFHIMVLNLPGGAGPGDALGQLLGYLMDSVKIDPDKLVFVSTQVFDPYFNAEPLLQKGRFVKRDLSEAQAAGDGSGFFAPAGHPDTKGFATVSIHYPIGAGTTGELSYPLPGYLEIGEISLAEPSSGGGVGGGLGLERLAMAMGAAAPTFSESRVTLFEKVGQEASKTGAEFPIGLEAFAE
ncbi:hypothetical protein [uncultured Roseibium sp.]|uniref:hypothetical protein n=1 Tax=uncultured Roseibium sp. TaxID=1936171 RepID=UPI00262CC892|nr:hypothetical protein [uncultured Roseibium sp.]